MERDIFQHPYGPRFLHLLKGFAGEYGVRALVSLDDYSKKQMWVHRPDDEGMQMSISAKVEGENATDISMHFRVGQLFKVNSIKPKKWRERLSLRKSSEGTRRTKVTYSKNPPYVTLDYDAGGEIKKTGRDDDLLADVKNIITALEDSKEKSEQFSDYLATLSLESVLIFTNNEADQIASATHPLVMDFLLKKGLQTEELGGLKWIYQMYGIETVRAVFYKLGSIIEREALLHPESDVMKNMVGVAKEVLGSFLQPSPYGWFRHGIG